MIFSLMGRALQDVVSLGSFAVRAPLDLLSEGTTMLEQLVNAAIEDGCETEEEIKIWIKKRLDSL